LDKEEAVTLFEQGAKAGLEDDGPQRCVRKLGDTKAYLAREEAVNQAADARACIHVAVQKRSEGMRRKSRHRTRIAAI